MRIPLGAALAILVTVLAVPAYSELALPAEFADYHLWKSYLNMKMPADLVTRCYVPPIEVAYLTNERADKGPHSQFFSVYFNKAAADVLSHLRTAKFPPGSMIIKEKKIAKEGPAVELGAMLKLGEGAKPQSGDWEYIFVDSKSQIVRGPAAQAACGGCHSKAGHTDYIFGNYVK